MEKEQLKSLDEESYITILDHYTSAIEKSIEGLEKRIDFIQSMRSDNHKMWDNQILALSTLCLGLSFAAVKDFVPLDGAIGTSLFVISLVGFLSAITLTVANFYFAEQNNLLSLESNYNVLRHRAEILNKLQSDFMKVSVFSKKNIDVSQLRAETIDAALQKDHKTGELFNVHHARGEATNKTVTTINNVRTVAFLIGIISLFIFFLANTKF